MNKFLDEPHARATLGQGAGLAALINQSQATEMQLFSKEADSSHKQFLLTQVLDSALRAGGLHIAAGSPGSEYVDPEASRNQGMKDRAERLARSAILPNESSQQQSTAGSRMPLGLLSSKGRSQGMAENREQMKYDHDKILNSTQALRASFMQE